MSRWLGVVPHPYTAWHARQFLAQASLAETPGGDIPRVIVLRANPRLLVGLIGLRRIADTTASLGYWIAPAHQRRGFAREAAQALLAYAFAGQDIERVTATALPDNVASRRVLEAAGLVRQRRRAMLFVRSWNRKMAVDRFELTRERWQARDRQHRLT